MLNPNVSQHDADVKKLQEEVCRWQKNRNRDAQTLSLSKKALQSNTTRSNQYKQNSHRLQVDSLNRILSIDADKMVALCEPRVSMLQLAKETFKKGLIPLVVPEFKGITVGGAIMGCGGESSSHKYGLFQDIATRYQLLLGDGSVIWASQTEHSDLFHAVGGSYGSLAVLLAAEVRLQKALPWVTLTYYHTASPHDAITRIRERMRASNRPEYIEGIIFSPHHAVVIEGEQSPHPEQIVFKDSLFTPWYYRHAKEQKSKVSVPLIDYLFRYDRGAFWMGAYVLRPTIIKRLFFEGIWKLQKPRPFSQDDRKRFSAINQIGSLHGALCYPLTSSQRLYSLLHACEKWVADRFLIQDFTLPEHTVGRFLDEVMQHSIFPLWLCPVQATEHSPLFAPHALGGLNSINIGVYGIPNSDLSIFDTVCLFEQKLAECGGRKWLYTHSSYTIDEFWKIYQESLYRQLRDKYNANGMWISIEQKVLSH